MTDLPPSQRPINCLGNCVREWNVPREKAAKCLWMCHTEMSRNSWGIYKEDFEVYLWDLQPWAGWLCWDCISLQVLLVNQGLGGYSKVWDFWCFDLWKEEGAITASDQERWEAEIFWPLICLLLVLFLSWSWHSWFFKDFWRKRA